MKDETSMIVTCPHCKSRHVRTGDTDYCPDCPQTAAGLKPHEVMDALRLTPVERGMRAFIGSMLSAELDEDYNDPFHGEMSHDDFVGWEIGNQ